MGPAEDPVEEGQVRIHLCFSDGRDCCEILLPLEIYDTQPRDTILMIANALDIHRSHCYAVPSGSSIQ